VIDYILYGTATYPLVISKLNLKLYVQPLAFYGEGQTHLNL